MGGLRFSSVAALPDSIRLKVEAQGNGVSREPQTKASKYSNKPTTVDGCRFDSKKEAAYYSQLRIRVTTGEVSYFLMQVPLRLPGGTKYIVDFQVFLATGAVQYVDVKGKKTEAFQIKKREVEHTYPIRVECV